MGCHFKVVDSYYIEEEEYSMEIFYTYTEDRGDYYSPPSSDLEINKVLINSEDLTQLYWDYIESPNLLEIISEDAKNKI
jgi:hypothetical protein